MDDNGYVVIPSHTCAACGANNSLVLESRDLPFEYRGQVTIISAVHGQFCTACGEGFSDPEYAADWQRMSCEVNAFIKKVDAFTAAEVRTIRKKLGLRQAEAGKLFGGGASAFSEYECGKTQPHKSTVLLLNILGRHPELLKELM